MKELWASINKFYFFNIAVLTAVTLSILLMFGVQFRVEALQDEMLKAMDDLVAHGLDILTLGQYLQPTKMHHEVIEWIHPDTFAMYREEGLKRGLKYVESGPLVRSSYHSERHVNVPI